jgi:hypothetical protein
VSDVKLLAAWDGWCDPCATERPLVLVEIGPRGLRSWLHGVGSEDRTLSLTCRVCGQWQLVPHLEEDDEPVEAAVDTPAAAVAAPAESTPDTVISPVLASALIPVRTAAFDETGRVVASTPAAESVPRPRTEVQLLDEEPPAEEAPAPRSRWFSRKAAVVVPAEEAPVAEVVETAAEQDAEQDAEPRTRWFSRKAAVQVPAEDAPVAEAAPVAETVEEAAEEAVEEDAEPVEPRVRWFTRRTTAQAAVTATTVTPAVAPRPVPRSIAPDVEEPVRPHKVNPAAVRPLPQTRAIPVPRTYRAPISAPSATDTSPLALLAAGYDVVAAGTR